jgi:hypothetical protein
VVSPTENEELRVLEEWFATHGYVLEFEVADTRRVEAAWMAIVRHSDGRPAYVTGYGQTRLAAARSACHRLLRLVRE